MLPLERGGVGAVAVSGHVIDSSNNGGGDNNSITNDKGLWTASWTSFSTSFLWTISNFASEDRIIHSDYLSRRRSHHNTNNNQQPLEIDPYLGKPSKWTDTDPTSWEAFYPGLNTSEVECFGRATNNELYLKHSPYHRK